MKKLFFIFSLSIGLLTACQKLTETPVVNQTTEQAKNQSSTSSKDCNGCSKKFSVTVDAGCLDNNALGIRLINAKTDEADELVLFNPTKNPDGTLTFSFFSCVRSGDPYLFEAQLFAGCKFKVCYDALPKSTKIGANGGIEWRQKCVEHSVDDGFLKLDLHCEFAELDPTLD